MGKIRQLLPRNGMTALGMSDQLGQGIAEWRTSMSKSLCAQAIFTSDVKHSNQPLIWSILRVRFRFPLPGESP